MRKLVCSFLLTVLLAYSGEASAQDGTSRGKVTSISTTSDSQVHTYKLYYRWNEVDIDRSYLNNSENIEQIVRHLQLSPQLTASPSIPTHPLKAFTSITPISLPPVQKRPGASF